MESQFEDVMRKNCFYWFGYMKEDRWMHQLEKRRYVIVKSLEEKVVKKPEGDGG